MRYRLLGRSGLRVSELSLGAMSFGTDWGWGVDHSTSRAIFDAYADAGGNFLDTAVNYTDGTSERWLGEFMGADRDRFVVATKYSMRDGTSDMLDPNAGGNHRKNLVRSVERSLRQLGTDHVDLYYLHAWDWTTPVDEVLRTFDDLVRAGKVRYVAFSDTPAWVMAKAVTMADLRGWTPLVATQFKYSLSIRDAEADLVPMARSEDLAMTTWGVLDRGVLSGRYAGRDTTRRGDEIDDRRAALGELVVRVAADAGVTPAQAAIAWIRQQDRGGPPILPLIGARSVEQIKEAMDAVDVVLDESHLHQLDEASAMPLPFPASFLSEPRIATVVHGRTGPLLDSHRAFTGHAPRGPGTVSGVPFAKPDDT